VSDVLVYAHPSRVDTARTVLAAACATTGLGARLDVYGSGSLYQRLGPRRAAPMPDLVWWFGPYAAQAAGIDGLLQAYQPARVADDALHDPQGKWLALEHSAVGIVGSGVSGWQDLGGVARLAMADPERSEVGLMLVLASLDRARQVDGDPERGWAWWQQRVHDGLVLAEDDAGAVALVQSGQATHALTLGPGAAPLTGLAPLPHAIGLAASSRNVDAARRMLDWLASDAAAASLSLSPWQSASNGLSALQQAAPPLDVDWGRQQYVGTRQRWAQSGFGPTLEA
jgi:ABC-type Fe3+ transport system substrate-binding protein